MMGTDDRIGRRRRGREGVLQQCLANPDRDWGGLARPKNACGRSDQDPTNAFEVGIDIEARVIEETGAAPIDAARSALWRWITYGAR